MNFAQADVATEITDWLIGEARLMGDSVAIVDGFARRLIEAGVPLWRFRAAQRLKNPLLAAWGVIWRADLETPHIYTIRNELLQTNTWIGSPFQYVVNSGKSFRRRLFDLDSSADHSVLHELVADGATDFFVMPIYYGDGSVQGASMVSNHPNGFSDVHLALFETLAIPLAAAMEPAAMRRSSTSLLRTYLGDGPANAVVDGAISRGDVAHIDAVVMITDLRGFTDKSARWDGSELLAALDSYFELTVDAVRRHDGDILKFLGDGLLAVFPIAEGSGTAKACRASIAAALDARKALATLNQERESHGKEPLEFGTGLHVGPVSYGNIGSPDRLDFTVIGGTVNMASRIQDLCKGTGYPILGTTAVASHSTDVVTSVGHHDIRGLSEAIELFSIASDA